MSALRTEFHYSSNPIPARSLFRSVSQVRIVAVALLAVMLSASTLQADETATGEKVSEADTLMAKGQAIWMESCAICHGDTGEGVADSYATPLVGDKTIGQLADVITKTMPEGEPEVCDGEDALAVATWIHHSFYSEAARLRNRPPKVMLTHLTTNQVRQSLADLYGHGRDSMWRENKRGLNAMYFNGSRYKREELKIERVDPVIHFDWGKESPGEGIGSEAFYVQWRGGLKVDETGRYEIVMRSTAAFKMDFGRFGREFIDNHVQSGDKTEFRETLTLIAGRVYPIEIDLYQRERKTEQPPVVVSLSWVPPHGVEEIIPTRNLIPTSPPATFALQANLPPDDRSYGFDRGLAIDRSWDESTTKAAVEFATIAVNELWPNYQRSRSKEPDENRSKLRKFVLDIAEVAFRGPLNDEERTFYVDEQVDATEDDALAIKRCLLAILKSPRFLYPSLDRDRSESQRAANRLALTLFDSLPVDKDLIEAARKDKLQTEDQIRQMAKKMVRDYRCEAKSREMLQEWLNLSHFAEVSKDSELYPDFDRELVADLRDSLHAMLDDVILSSESDYRKLFSADSLYSSDHLAAFYGEGWSRPEVEETAAETGAEESESESKSSEYVGLQPVDEFFKVKANFPYNQGVLSHPYLMTGLAYTDTTSPIHRGVFLVRYMLGRTLRPPNEAFTPLSPDLHPGLTTRQRVELQTSPDSCQVCHVKINQLGFTLESFDTVGRFRQMEAEKPIDTSGSYTDRTGDTTTFAGSEDLAKYLAESDDAHRAFVNRVFQHFVKQPIAAYGPETQDHLTEVFRMGNYNLQNLLVEVAVIAAMPPSTSSSKPTEIQ
ncbi:DUF1588 domain-containing protein [Thalassoglobus sp. JC818]|uniref:DUF1588 domain-containing protein n=1 Tax=Thalassoglobus sp. JC818 TaxID=3232136 RepID=UPI00345B46DA